jgi:dihydroorotate dehydrogenase (fumarate)
MTNLQTNYLGLTLKNPLIASASPLSKKVDTARQLEDAGVSAVIMHSLFEEQVIKESYDLDHFLSRKTESIAESLTFLPEMQQYAIGPDAYVDRVKSIKEALDIPVIASLNGTTPGGWVEYAKKIQDSGADALELNLYDVVTDFTQTSSDLEESYLELVQAVQDEIEIPLAVKLSPFFTALPNFIQHLSEAGVNGVVLFNRFYQPDLDIEELEVTPSLQLSDSSELLLPLRWIALLYGRVEMDFALTSGVHSAEDILKAMMAGAKAAMSTSALLKNGVSYASELLEDLVQWMEEHEYESIQQMQGSLSQLKSGEENAYERANYITVLGSYR